MFVLKKMLMVRYSNLMQRRPSSRGLNVQHRHQTEKELEESRAQLLSKLWLKASTLYDYSNKQTETRDIYPDEPLQKTQDLWLSNNNDYLKMKDSAFIHTVFLINQHIQNHSDSQHNSQKQSHNIFSDKKFCGDDSVLDIMTYDMLWKTLGDHIDNEKERIF